METFVIRVWLPAPTAPEAEPGLVRIHGIVEHVGTGRASAFAGIAELEALVLSAIRRDRLDQRPTDPVALTPSS